MKDTYHHFFQSLTQRIINEIPPVDLHIHTNWTDGSHSVKEMYQAACEKNMECILFSEHARKSSSSWFTEYVEDVRSLPSKSCFPMVGVETRVRDHHGNIEIDRDIYSLCDVVIGSVHRFPDKDCNPIPFERVSPVEALDIEFNLAMALINNPRIQILGHPMGMCQTQYGMPIPEALMRDLARAAKHNNKVFEINSKYCSDPWPIIRFCAEIGVMISLGSDAHAKEEVGNIYTLLKEGKS